uniref:Protein TsetseEP domain-containing protein n=1 Tax=Musca domestica TaxID=7370 RepID=A0A1I8M951_MUSDO
MWKLLIFTILLQSNDKSSASIVAVKARQNDIKGPSTHVMENLALHTHKVAEDLTTQLSNKIEVIGQTIIGDIEVIIDTALDQLTQPIIEIQTAMEKPECQRLLTMDELRDRIDSQLTGCTKNLNDLLNNFHNDTREISKSLEFGSKQIENLPSQCENTEYSFASLTVCFIEKIAELNRDMAILLNRASMQILHTHQLANVGAETSRNCAERVVNETVEYLDRILETCSNHLHQEDLRKL